MMKAIAALLTGALSLGAVQVMTLVWSTEVDVRGTRGTIEAAEFSLDGRSIASGSADGKLRVWNRSNRNLVWESTYWDGSLERRQGQVEAVAFSPDGHVVAAGGNSAGVKVYSASDGELVTDLEGEGADGIAFSRNGRYLVAPSKGNVRFYNPSNWERYDDLRIRHRCDVNSIDFSPNDEYVVTGSCDRTVQIMRMANGDIVRQINAAAEGGSVKSVRVSPNGRWIATGNGREHVVKIFRFDNGELITTLRHPGMYVEAVAFSPDGRYLATTGGDQEDNTPSERTAIRIYRIDGDDFELQEQLISHAEGVEYLDFSADSEYLLSAGEDGILKLWRVNQSRAAVAPLVAIAAIGIGVLGVGAIAFRHIRRRD